MTGRARGVLARACVAAAAVGGCSDPPIDPPTAVIRIDPPAICRGDDFSTDVTLSGLDSASRLTLVPVPPEEGEPPLLFQWSLRGAAHEIDVGDLESPELRLRTAGDRPLHVTLTVVNAELGQATSTDSLSITVPAWPGCDGDCPRGTRCFDAPSGPRCIPDRACELNVDCEICMVCDISARLCVPQEGAL